MSPTFADVPEDQYDPCGGPAIVAEQGGAVIDGAFPAVLGDEHGVVWQDDVVPISQGADGGALDPLTALFVDDVKDAFQAHARGLGLRPAGQGLGHRVQEGNAAVVVGRDDRVADAGEGVTQPLRPFARFPRGPLGLGCLRARVHAYLSIGTPLPG